MGKTFLKRFESRETGKSHLYKVSELKLERICCMDSGIIDRFVKESWKKSN